MPKRHQFFYKLLRPLVIVFLRLKFGYTYTIAKDLPDTYIVLSNHTTDYDPLFVCASFPEQMYFVGSEHVARWKGFFNILYQLLNHCLGPITRPKGALASSTVMEMLRRVRSGGNVCLFAEGVRSWDGLPAPILPSTGKMIKSARCGLVTYRITGGYFVSPMWSSSSKTRRGPIHGAPVNVYTPEQLSKMTAEEIQSAIVRDLAENAYERQLANPQKYTGKTLAENMENFLFICPHCKQIDTLRSHGETVSCNACQFTFRYTEYGMLENAPFTTLADWSLWQTRELTQAVEQNEIYTAPAGTLTQIKNHQELPITQGLIQMSQSALVCGEVSFPLDRISDLAMHGKRAIVFSVGKDYYELIPAVGSNALKFMLYYQIYKQQLKTTSAV